MNRDASRRTAPLLLFNGECAVCRAIAGWVGRSIRVTDGQPNLTLAAIGDDPGALRALDPELDIWDAYETIHLLMPDGSMKTGGEAVAEVLRRLPNTAWFAWTFGLRAFGVHPFQAVLDAGYLVLSDVRPLLGCESCGLPNVWVRSIRHPLASVGALLGAARHPALRPHFTAAPKR